jgi:chloramphenicol 3-O phosphotransferase
MTQTGVLILINGASSAGKTSLVRALQREFEAPYLDAGLDRFLWMLPSRYLERPLWDEVLGLATEAGSTGHRLVLGMHRAIEALLDSGSDVVADHVLVERVWLADAARRFADRRAYFIGVRCPLPVLEQRERARKDRTLGQARAQHALVHAHGVYDLEIDTSIDSPEACARQIRTRVEAGPPPDAFRRLREAFEATLPCRAGCGACCIALSISSPIPGMPGGKPSGVRCVQLTPDNLCSIFGQPDRPEVCNRLRPSLEMCGTRTEEALAYLYALEAATCPGEGI